MKTILTTKQTKHLINLGVPKEKASLKLPIDSFAVIDMPIPPGLPIFTIQDFLNGEILPEELYSETYLDSVGNKIVPDSYGNYELVMRRWYKKWAVWYENGEEWQLCSKCFEAKELIDALYKYTCWYYGEYLKKKRNKQI